MGVRVDCCDIVFRPRGSGAGIPYWAMALVALGGEFYGHYLTAKPWFIRA